MKYSGSGVLSFTNENSLERVEMLVGEGGHRACVACINETDISILDRYECF